MALSKSEVKQGIFAQSSMRLSKARRLGAAYVMLGPFLVLFLVFVVWPILNSLYLSFTQYSGIKPPEFVGLQNYQKLIEDQRFIQALQNTVIFVVAIVTLNSIAGLAVAMAFRKPTIINQICRALFFLPAVTSTVATSVLWRTIFTGEDFGLGNTIRHLFGLETISFTSQPEWTIPIIVIVSMWGGLGGTMIIFLAGLQSIPGDLTEASAIDGATAPQRFLFITVPLLKPTTLYIVITGLIGAFQIFDVVYLLYPSIGNVGGPLDSALMIVPYLYDRGFDRFQLGYASSIAWVLFAIIFVLTALNLRLGREKDV